MVNPLEPERAEMETQGTEILHRVIDFIESLPDRPASTTGTDPRVIAETVRDMLAPPSEYPGVLDDLLTRLDQASAHALETSGPGYLGYIPGGGLFISALSSLYAHATNRYVGLAGAAPGLAALEHSVVRWLCQVCGMPEGASGLLLSGGSMANFTAMVAARHAGLGEHLEGGRIYLTAHAHHSVAKAASLAGLPSAAVRVVDCTSDLRMDVNAASRMIAEDRAAGRRPFLLVASAGTTNTGVVDPLAELADLAAREGLWFHVDGAYGGLFRLTATGQRRLAGIERADSVTLDPHKSLFLPYGIGALVVRDPDRLRAAHAGSDHYLQDLAADEQLPDYTHLGPELTRDLRGLRAWLPLHLYGVGAFREALEEKLDLAQLVHQRLSAELALEVPWEPDLTVVAFRMRAPRAGQATVAEAGDWAESASRRLLERVNANQRIFLSSTMIDGRFMLRLCVLSHRTHVDRVTEAVDLIVGLARELAAEWYSQAH